MSWWVSVRWVDLQWVSFQWVSVRIIKMVGKCPVTDISDLAGLAYQCFITLALSTTRVTNN